MAQFQSVYGVVNEPTDAQREYQTTTAVINTQSVAGAAVTPPVRSHPLGMKLGMFRRITGRHRGAA